MIKKEMIEVEKVYCDICGKEAEYKCYSCERDLCEEHKIKVVCGPEIYESCTDCSEIDKKHNEMIDKLNEIIDDFHDEKFKELKAFKESLKFGNT